MLQIGKVTSGQLSQSKSSLICSTCHSNENFHLDRPLNHIKTCSKKERKILKAVSSPRSFKSGHLTRSKLKIYYNCRITLGVHTCANVESWAFPICKLEYICLFFQFKFSSTLTDFQLFKQVNSIVLIKSCPNNHAGFSCLNGYKS